RPHLRIAVPLLATVLRPVLDEGADRRVDESVVVPEGILEVALQQQLVIGVGQSHQQCSIPVADVSGFVGLYRQEYSGQEVVAVGCGLRWHCHEQCVCEGGFGDDLEIDVARRDRVASDEALSELPSYGPRITSVQGSLGCVD